MKELPTTGGWEIVIEDTSTLTSMHMRSTIDVIANREREPCCRPQQQQAHREQQSLAATRVSPVASGPQAAAIVTGFVAAESQFDPNAPKCALNPFFWFLKENRHRWTQPGMPAPEATKAASIAWAALSNEEKEHYHERAAQDKERYEREMTEYLRGMRNK